MISRSPFWLKKIWCSLQKKQPPIFWCSYYRFIIESYNKSLHTEASDNKRHNNFFSLSCFFTAILSSTTTVFAATHILCTFTILDALRLPAFFIVTAGLSSGSV